MRQVNQFNRFASRMIVAMAICLLTVSLAWSNSEKDRKNAARNLAVEIERGQFHKVYVPDFLDPSGVRTEKGCYFASTFSTNLAKAAHNFEVVNRIQVQKQLNELHISPQDLQQPELLSKAAAALGADAVLVGVATFSPRDAALILSLREAASGREVHSTSYHEKLEPVFDSSFPAVEDANSHFYHFPGLDGVSQPKCKYCPNPDFTDEARRNKIQGDVMLSVSIDEQGVIHDIRVVQDPGHGLAQRSIEALKKWRMESSRDPQGNAVTVRVAIETTFRLLYGPH